MLFGHFFVSRQQSANHSTGIVVLRQKKTFSAHVQHLSLFESKEVSGKKQGVICKKRPTLLFILC